MTTNTGPISTIGERDLHAMIAERWHHSGGWRGVAVGPGDDAAVVEGGGGVRWLVTADQLVEGRHYTPGTPPERIGYKAIARSVSDIAAMAGEPKYAVATALVPDRRAPEVPPIFEAIDKAGRLLACPIVGGDIASYAGDAFVITATVIGEAHGDRGAVLRSAAAPGDGVYVSGTIGGANTASSPSGAEHHLVFEPRIRAARGLADMLGRRLHAMIDLSDGLGIDAHRLAEASGVTLTIDATRVPLSRGITHWKQAVAQGEDYELLFTTPASEAEVVSAGESVGVPMTRIGSVEQQAAHAGPGARFIDGTECFPAQTMGHEH